MDCFMVVTLIHGCRLTLYVGTKMVEIIHALFVIHLEYIVQSNKILLTWIRGYLILMKFVYFYTFPEYSLHYSISIHFNYKIINILFSVYYLIMFT